MPEDVQVESASEEPGDGGYFSLVDGILLVGVVVIVLALIIRFRKRKIEERNSLRNLRVITE